jgi:hypothetical protein
MHPLRAKYEREKKENLELCIKTYLRDGMEVFEELSSEKIQKKVWLNIDNDTGLMGLFEETMQHFFYGVCYESFKKDGYLEKTFSKEYIEKLYLLEKLCYDYGYDLWQYHSIEIFKDKNWIKVMNLSKELFEMHQKETGMKPSSIWDNIR